MDQKDTKKEIKESTKSEIVEEVLKKEEVENTPEVAENISETKNSKILDKASTETKEEKVTDRNGTFRVGDTVKVFYKIIEGGKERIQPYEGTVISKRGEGVSKTFIVRRIGIGGIGVERIFPMYSPKITELTVLRKGKARRAKLFYLRKTLSKKDARIKERI